MALYIPRSIFHLARLLYVRPETFGPYYVYLKLVHGNEVGPRAYFCIVTLQWLPCVLCEVRAETKEKVEQQEWLPQLTVVSSGKYVLRGKKKLSISMAAMIIETVRYELHAEDKAVNRAHIIVC